MLQWNRWYSPCSWQPLWPNCYPALNRYDLPAFICLVPFVGHSYFLAPCAAPLYGPDWWAVRACYSLESQNIWMVLLHFHIPGTKTREVWEQSQQLIDMEPAVRLGGLLEGTYTFPPTQKHGASTLLVINRWLVDSPTAKRTREESAWCHQWLLSSVDAAAPSLFCLQRSTPGLLTCPSSSLVAPHLLSLLHETGAADAGHGVCITEKSSETV